MYTYFVPSIIKHIKIKKIEVESGLAEYHQEKDIDLSIKLFFFILVEVWFKTVTELRMSQRPHFFIYYLMFALLAMTRNVRFIFIGYKRDELTFI